MHPDAQPKFFKPWPVPFTIKSVIEQELDQLEASGAIEKVTCSDWAAPIVPVPKKDGKFWMCGDYKVTINHALDAYQYPLPKPKELFATLAGGKKFSKLDLSQHLPATHPGRTIDQICHHQYSQGIVPLETTTFQSCFCTGHVPKTDGHGPSANSKCHLLH